MTLSEDKIVTIKAIIMLVRGTTGTGTIEQPAVSIPKIAWALTISKSRVLRII